MKKSLLLLALTLALSNNAFAAFIISTNSRCYGKDVYTYHFSSTAFSPDYTVKVSSTAFSPDLTIKIVADPKKANLILVDDYKDGDMQICKKSTSFGAKTIKVSSTAFSPDITVKLTDYSFSVDYTIFVASERMTVEEAAALFAVIWQAYQ
ncbi:hypothetical protein H4F17_18740 [Vibrio cholerae]